MRLGLCGSVVATLAGAGVGCAPKVEVAAAPDAGKIAPVVDGSVTRMADGPATPLHEVAGDAGACVQIDVSNTDQACSTDSDCTLVSTGLLCDQPCLGCGPVAAVNMTAAARVSSETASLPSPSGGCGPCEPAPATGCISGQCVTCAGPKPCVAHAAAPAPFGQGAAPAFPPGNGSACTASVGSAPSSTCDPSDEQGCSALAGNGCVIAPECTAGDPACEAFTKNSGGIVIDFRMRYIEITAPPSLASNSIGLVNGAPGFFQTDVITKGVDLANAPANCGENGQGLCSTGCCASTRCSTTRSRLEARHPARIRSGSGYCFLAMGWSGACRSTPVTIAATLSASQLSSQRASGTLNMPIFLMPMDTTDAVVLPIRGIGFDDVTVSNDGNCIGAVNNAALAGWKRRYRTRPRRTGPPALDGTRPARWPSGYMTLADADKVQVVALVAADPLRVPHRPGQRPRPEHATGFSHSHSSRVERGRLLLAHAKRRRLQGQPLVLRTLRRERREHQRWLERPGLQRLTRHVTGRPHGDTDGRPVR